MKSIKNQYIALKEGKMTEAQFMRNVRMSLPQYISNVTLFKQAEKILINKGIISEINLGNNQWLNTFENALGFKTYMSPNWIIDNYGDLDPKEAANKFIEDTTATQMAHDDETFRRETSESLEEDHTSNPKDKYTVKFSKSNNTYQVMEGDEIITDFATKEKAEKEAKRLNTLENIKQLDKKQIKEAKDTSATGYFNQDGKEQYGKFDEIDNMNAQEVMMGYVLEKIDNPDKDKMEICKLVIKNLKKDQFYYTNYKLTGIRDQQPVEFTSTKRKPGFDQAEEVSKKADNLIDTKNATTVVKEGLELTRKNKLKEMVRKVMKEMFDGRDNLTDVNEIDEIPKALKNLEVGDVFRVVGDVDWSVQENTNYKITFLGDYLLDFKTVKNPEHAALGQTGTMNLNRFKENVLSGNIIIYPK